MEGINQKIFAEFFAGIGLVRIGLEQAGWKVAFANDISQKKERIYKTHFKDNPSHFKLEDIHNLKAEDIPDIHLATASFPCTDLSLAGRREGLSGKESSAFWGFINVLNEMGPKSPQFILLENVDAFLSSNKGEDFKEALLAINDLGYSVDPFIIDASHFVPQSRVRLFIVCKKNRTNSSTINERQLSFYQSQIRGSKLANFILSHPEINWDLRDLPSLPKRTITLENIIEDIPTTSKDWWSADRVQYLLNQTYERHFLLIQKASKEQYYSYFTAFRRVRNGKSMAEIRSDGIAGCLRTPKGGSARQILIVAGKGEIKIRLLSPRECARLMGAGDYDISGSINDALFGFGDAVCVPVIKWLADNYLNPLIEEANKSFERYKLRNEYEQASVHI